MSNLKVAVLGAVVAIGLTLVLRGRQRRAAAEADLWAEATDHVTRTPREG